MKPKFRLRDHKRKEWYGASDLSSLTRYGFQRFGECYYQGHIPIEDLKDLELSQFTGLVDKNFNGVYSGDIIKDSQGKKGEVVFTKGGFAIKSIGKTIKKAVLRRCEIIGNIYENPELLD